MYPYEDKPVMNVFYGDKEGIFSHCEEVTRRFKQYPNELPNNRPLCSDGWVYFFVMDSCPLTVKIGFSSNPYKRFCGLKTLLPYELKFYGAVMGDEFDEVKAHMIFGGCHRRGEWFDFDIAHWAIDHCIFANKILSQDTLFNREYLETRGLNKKYKLRTPIIYYTDGEWSDVMLKWNRANNCAEGRMKRRKDKMVALREKL